MFSIMGSYQSVEVIQTPNAQSIKDKNGIIDINIEVIGERDSHRYDDEFNCEFIVQALYLPTENMRNIFQEITTFLSHKHYPRKVDIFDVGYEPLQNGLCESFTGKVTGNRQYQTVAKTPITFYPKNDILKKGLKIRVFLPKYEHKIKESDITCPEMIKMKTSDPQRCPVYHRMKEKYEWNKHNLHHLNEYDHFTNIIDEKQPCKYADACKAFIRLENGGNKIDDRCHLKLYRHPPRRRNIRLSENLKPLVINKKQEDNHPIILMNVFNPDRDFVNDYEYSAINGYLGALMEEVISNGYRYDLCTECGANDNCKHSDFSLLRIVDEKLNHPRHKAMMDKPLRRDHMLSLILYTGCDCNYDLCKSQRMGDYKKWKVFDCCLWDAIQRLSSRENGSFTVYSGLNGVHLPSKETQGYFVTYVSTSWRKEVATSFMDGNGMVVQIDKKFKYNYMNYCCDVSWISKFEDEAEILFARSRWMCYGKPFRLSVVDCKSGIQTVSLTTTEK
eukprot:136252_1